MRIFLSAIVGRRCHTPSPGIDNSNVIIPTVHPHCKLCNSHSPHFGASFAGAAALPDNDNFGRVPTPAHIRYSPARKNQPSSHWLVPSCEPGSMSASRLQLPRRGCRPSNSAVAAETLRILTLGSYKVQRKSSADGGDTSTASTTSVALPRHKLRRAAKDTCVVSHQALAHLPDAPADAPDSPEITVFNGDSFHGAAWLLARSADLRPLVLDFASDSNPGGGFRGNQQGTQEESLCRRSNLGACLEDLYQRTGQAGYMANECPVYAPEIVVFRG